MSLFGEHFQRGRISLDEKEAAIHAWSRPGALTAMLNWYRASTFVIPADDVATPEIDEAIDALRVITPTLVIWGMQDKLLLPCLLDGLEEFVPQLTVTRREGAGHGLIHEEPEEIIALIRDWLAAH